MKSGKWLGLCALMPALAMVFVDQSILPVALPAIGRDLHAGDVALQWTVNIYILVTAILVLVGGKISDRFGYRDVYAAGMVIFAVASAFCGLSQDILSLIGARALQGVGAAIMIPSSMPLLMSLFPQSERGKAIGINVSVSSLFLMSAPLIGGYLTQYYSWHWIFWINLPIAALGIFLVFSFIPRTAQGTGKVDLLGFVFFLVSATSLIVAIMQGEDWGWISRDILGLFALFLIAASLLIWREKKAKHPFLDLSLFRHPVYKAANISFIAVSFILMIVVFRTIFLEQTFEWSPSKTGMVTCFASIPFLFAAPVAGFLSDRRGSKLPIALGFALLLFSFFFLALFIQDDLAIIFVGLVTFSCGIPMIFTPSVSAAMSAIPPTKAGVAFGTLNTMRNFGSALGLAVIGAFINHIQRRENQGTELSAELNAFVYSHLALAFLLMITFLFVFVLYNRKATHHLPETPAEGWD